MKTPKYNASLLKSVGNDVLISSNVEIKRPHLVSIGSHVSIDSGFYATTALELKDHIHIAPYVTVIGGESGLLKMGNFTNISVGGRIICGSDEFLGEGLVTAPGIPEKFRDTLIVKPIIFEDFVNTGANVVILPGVRLGEGSVIGACSLVTEDTEPWTIYVGTPAKPIKLRSREKMLDYARQMGYR